MGHPPEVIREPTPGLRLSFMNPTEVTPPSLEPEGVPSVPGD